MLRLTKRNFSKVYKNYVNGQYVASRAPAAHNIPIFDPLDNTKIIGQVP